MIQPLFDPYDLRKAKDKLSRYYAKAGFTGPVTSVAEEVVDHALPIANQLSYIPYSLGLIILSMINRDVKDTDGFQKPPLRGFETIWDPTVSRAHVVGVDATWDPVMYTLTPGSMTTWGPIYWSGRGTSTIWDPLVV